MFELNNWIKINDLIYKISELYYILAIDLAKYFLSGYIPKGTVQNENEVTISIWRDEEDYRINWRLSAERIKCFDELFLENIFQLNVSTQFHNKKACHFYEKSGFKVKSIITIYHVWL
jgi:hypothetical protein